MATTAGIVACGGSFSRSARPGGPPRELPGGGFGGRPRGAWAAAGREGEGGGGRGRATGERGTVTGQGKRPILSGSESAPPPSDDLLVGEAARLGPHPVAAGE